MNHKVLILNGEDLRSDFGEVCDDIGYTRTEEFRNSPSQIRIHVNVQSLAMECESGSPAFFDSQQGTQRLALERYTVELSEQNPTCGVTHLIDAIASLREITQLHDSSAPPETGLRRQPLDAYVQDDCQFSESGLNGHRALNIWV